MSPEYIQALYAGAGAPQGTTGGRAKFVNGRYELDGQAQKKKKNFLLDQISTVGGIAGGIGGSLITPILGTGAGAAAGSALGEALENALTGNRIMDNVGKEAALGAVFGAGPIKLLKGGAAGAKALATGADDVVGAASKAALTPLRQKAGQSLVNASDDLVIKQFRLTPTQLTNFKNKFGEDAAQTIKRYGFQNADDVTLKGIEPLQAQFDEAINGITGVTKESLKKNLMSRVGKLSSAGPSDTKAIGAQLKKEADSLLKGYGDVIDAKELNAIRRQFDDLVNYTEKAANPARYGVNKRMADALRETLQKADQTGTLKNLGRELNKVRQLDDVISRQGNLGRGSLPANLTNILGGVAGTTAAGGPMGAVGGIVAANTLNSPTGRRVLASGAQKAGSKLLSQGTTKQTAKGIAGRLGAVGTLKSMGGQGDPTLEDAMLDQSLLNNDPSMMANATTANPMMNADMLGTPYSESPEMSSLFAPENLENTIMQIMASGGDLNDVTKFVSLAKTVNELRTPKSESSKPLSQGQQERADLIRALDLTEQQMAGGSINYGPVGSRVEGVKSMFNAADPETLAFKNTVSGLRAAITKARAGASLTPGELKMLAQYTPSDTDSEQVVRSKLAQLRQLYGYAAPTGGMTLEDAMMQYAPQAY